MWTCWITLNFLFVTVYAGCNEDTILEFSDLNLRQSNVSWDSSSSSLPLVNDKNLNPGWYTAVQNGWQYLMTDSTTQLEYGDCNTYRPIYLKEPHPDVSSISETPKQAQACVKDALYPCDNTYVVEIRKCGDVIQYKLQSTILYGGFCFDKYRKIKGQPLPAPTDVQHGQFTVVPRLLFKQNANEFLPYTVFECNFAPQNQYFYTVNWFIGTTSVVELTPKGPTQNLEELRLTEQEFINSGFRLGIEVQCAVSVSRAENGLQTPTEYSPKFFAGIKVSNTTLFLEKNSKANITLTTTVPLGCRHTKGFTFTCVEDLRMYDPKAGNCQWGVAQTSIALPQNQRCASQIPSIPNTGTWNQAAEYLFEVATIDRTYDDASVFTLVFQFEETIQHKIWKGYSLPDFKVIVTNTEAYKQKICYCHIDPHMKTADETSWYEMQNHFGTYRLYRNTKYNIEVQIITTQCFGWYPTCACAVAVRAGQDIFMIDMCGSINYFGFIHCGDGGILQVVKVHDNMYNIFTPIGTLITVYRYYNYLNIDIVMAPKDIGHTEGLCGYFDGDPTNDFLQSNGVNNGYEYHPDTFSRSWRIGTGLNETDNLFRSNPELSRWIDDNKYYCVCEQSESVCSPSQYLNCTFPNDVTKQQCRIATNRKRRSLRTGVDKELERLMALMQPVYPRNIVKRDSEPNIFSEEEATTLCTNKINGSLAMTEYSDISANTDPDQIIKQCIYDVTVGRDVTLADAHVEAVNTVVKTMMDKEPVYVANNTEKVEVFLQNTCPGNCSGMGICTKEGVCNCTEFHHGSDCSIDERDPLTIDDIEGGGLCDMFEGGDCTCFIVRSDNVLNGFVCKALTFRVSMNGTETYVSTKMSPGEFFDIFTGRCCIPEQVLGSPDVFVAKYNFSISNIGINFGNEAPVYVYDSTCQNVSAETDDNMQFILKANSCFIDGYCFTEGDMPLAGCLACKSELNISIWTYHNPCENGGNCSGQDVGYFCSCQPGYDGFNCKHEINECALGPCKNGGNCTDQVNGFNCSCATGFIGLHCERDIDECSSNPCWNEATCVDLVNGFNCTCKEGFEGEACETDIDDCASIPCEKSHICEDQVNGYKCQCMDGYEGLNCDQDVDECKTLNQCQNGGTCENTHGSFNCSCVPGYSGVNCETGSLICLCYVKDN